jgi:hypothetical protein
MCSNKINLILFSAENSQKAGGSLITESDYIEQKKENVLLENQRLRGELKDQVPIL